MADEEHHHKVKNEFINLLPEHEVSVQQIYNYALNKNKQYEGVSQKVVGKHGHECCEKLEIFKMMALKSKEHSQTSM